MNWIALKMLFGDKTKYFGLVFGIAFSTLLIAQQASIYVGVMKRTANLIYETRDLDVWVMDKRGNCFDIIEPLQDTALNIVRSVPGVQWAVPYLKVEEVAKPIDGGLNPTTLVGVDDASLAGSPKHLVIGDLERLRDPDSVIIDTNGYRLFWPQDKTNYKLGRVLELNERRATVVGVADVMPTFTGNPIIYTRYSNALKYSIGGRKRMSYVMVKAQPNVSPEALARSIDQLTPFKAQTREEFKNSTNDYIFNNTGIPVNFAVTVLLGLIVSFTIVGLLLNMFISDNMRQFGALKAMGVNNIKLISMVLVQSLTVFAIGFSIGIGAAAVFFITTTNIPALKGFILPWNIVLLSGGLILSVTLLSSLFSILRIIKIDPAIVFKG